MKSFVVVSLALSAVALVYVSAGPMSGQDGSSRRNSLERLGSDDESRMKVKNDGGPLEDVRMKLYEVYMKLNNKTYVQDELPRRLETFWKNRQLILESIKNFTEGRSSWALRENKFTDMDQDEINKFGRGLKLPSLEEIAKERAEDEAENGEEAGEDTMIVKGGLPESVDWRSSGCIKTPVMDQGSCGSCYAAAVRNAMEAKRCLFQGSSPRLSHQQMVDCATPDVGYQNDGCGGGWPRESLKYLRDVKYMATNKCYQQTEGQEQCYFESMSNDCLVNASPSNGDRLKFKTLQGEQEILEAVANTGPVIVFVDRSNNFLNFGQGVFDGNDCRTDWAGINHVLLAIGYGTENGQDYWLLQNSYGPDFGVDGFIKIRRNEGTCAIGHYAVSITA